MSKSPILTALSALEIERDRMIAAGEEDILDPLDMEDAFGRTPRERIQAPGHPPGCHCPECKAEQASGGRP